MASYMVDGQVLTPDEQARHKAGCNAALCGTLSAFLEDRDGTRSAVGESVALAFDHADEVVREHRRRIERAYASIGASPAARYRMIDDEEIVSSWAQGELILNVPRNFAIGRVRNLAYPLTLLQICKAGDIRRDLVRELAKAAILVPVEDDADAG